MGINPEGTCPTSNLASRVQSNLPRASGLGLGQHGTVQGQVFFCGDVPGKILRHPSQHQWVPLRFVAVTGNGTLQRAAQRVRRSRAEGKTSGTFVHCACQPRIHHSVSQSAARRTERPG